MRPRHPHRLHTLSGVLPEHRGRRIGTELRDRIEERAREQAQDAPEGEEVWLGADVGSANEGATAVLRGARLRADPPLLGDGRRPGRGAAGARVARGDQARACAPRRRRARGPRGLRRGLRRPLGPPPDPLRRVGEVDGRVGELRPVSLAAGVGRRRDRRGLALRSRSGRGLGRRARRAAVRGGAAASPGRSSTRASARSAERGKPRAKLGVDAANPTGATRLYESAGCASSTSRSHTG